MINPIFIIANPRSGSSLFRLILNNTKESIFPPECGFIEWWYEKYKNWSLDKIDFFVKDLSTSKKIEGWDINFSDLSIFLKSKTPKSYAEVCMDVYQFYGNKNGKNFKVWGDKNNYYINHLDKISKIYPNAKYIWLKRNPKDICYSYLNLLSLPNDVKYKPKTPEKISDIFKEIKSNNQKIKSFLNSEKKFISVNFEDIVSKNEKVFNEISSFTNINFNLAFENFNNKIYFDEPSITIKWKEKTLEKIDESYIDTYLKCENSKEIELEYNKYF
jgi:hypothetical protein